LENIQKEVIMAYFEEPSQHVHGGTRKTIKTSDRIANILGEIKTSHPPLEQKSEVLLLKPTLFTYLYIPVTSRHVV
jgi:hypothetical protein